MPLPPLPVGPFDTETLLGDLNDTWLGSSGADLVYGGDGNDLLQGGDGNDYLDGGGGNDRLLAGRGDDTVLGGAGNDAIYGGNGFQQLFGGSGDDLLQSGDRNSTLDGGEGSDILNLNLAKGASFVVSGGSGADLFQIGAASISRIGTVAFTDFQAGTDAFTVDGVSASQVLNAGLSWTMLASGGFEITLASGDLLRFDGARSEDFWRTYGLSGADTITGSAVGEAVFTGYGADVVWAGGGNDLIVLGDDADYAEGGDGDDILNGLRGNDTIYGGNGADTIQEARGFNRLYGEAGDDVITAGSDASVLDGGSGDDTLIANSERGGGHSLTGGAGADVFEFRGITPARPFTATLADFDAAEDALMIGGIDGFAWIAQQGYAVTETEGGAVASFGGGMLTFAGITAETLEDLIPDLIIS